MPDQYRQLLSRLESLEEQTAEIQRALGALRAEVLQARRREAQPGAADSPAAPTREEDRRRRSEAEDDPERVEVSTAAAGDRGLDLEFWLGGRGLLLLGVVALVLAVGFFVRYSIEQGWLGPGVRVLLGAGVGIAAVVAGERTRARGYRTYGLWLAAGGFSATYLAVWGAAILYALIPIGTALVLMVGVVASAAALGTLRASQSFVALAAFGGYLAPLVLKVEPAAVGLSLVYLGLLTGAGLWLAHRFAWPGLCAIAVAGGTLMTLPGSASSAAYGSYLIVLVAAALLVARRYGWTGVGAETVSLGWVTLWAGSSTWGIVDASLDLHAGALWMACLVGSVGVRRWGRTLPHIADSRRPSGSTARRADLAELAGLVLLIVPPWAFYASVAVDLLDPPLSGYADAIRLGLGALLGAVYLGEGLIFGEGEGTANRIWRLTLGFAFWLAAPALVWSELGLALAWLLEGLAITVVGIVFRGVIARSVGLTAVVLAALAFYSALGRRPDLDAAFIGLWALTGLAVAIAPAAWTLGLGRVPRLAEWERGIRPLLLLVSAVLFLGWGTGEIQRFFEMRPAAADWHLARDLTISGFWLAYAAALLVAGFRLDRAPVRWAGLVMAAVATGKAFLYDLSHLAQLYRIASFVLLAAVLLTLSFRYQRLRDEK